MIRKSVFLLLSIVLVLGLPARSQTSPVPIKEIIASIDTFSSKQTPEKLYLQFDKPYYAIADTIWFKAYLFDASFLTASPKSGIVYIELANDTNKVLLRRMLRVYSGLGSGNIALPKDEVPEGSYTIRAYTNLMRNFGEDRIFKKTFYISGLTNQSWLVSANNILADSAGKTNLRLGLKLTKLDKSAVGLKDLQLRVMDGRRNIFRDKVQTDAEGKLDMNFNLPERVDKISIIAEEDLPTYAPINSSKEVKPIKVVIPISVSRPENIDLQFMPEGGNIVAGIAGKIGFKAIGEDGKGTDIAGKIYDSKNNEVASFKSTHKGMGSFYLNPQQGENYTAKIILPNGTTKSFLLPKIQQSGTTISIRNFMQGDSLEITVSVPQNGTSYYLIGQYGAVVSYAAAIKNNIRMKVPKKLFSTGIAHFTLLNADKKAVNERIVYIDHHDQLNISIIPNKISYKTRDSISLGIEVRDKTGKPIQGSFSLSVTDDGQVKTDSTNNIQTNVLLTSDLKGTVEEPNYYFNNSNEAWDALDNLLLTQGWIGYDEQKAFDPQMKIDFPAEKEFTVEGKVTNILNKPLGGVKVAMISTKPLFARDTLANSEGKFTFRDFPHLDTAVFKIQATNKRDKENNVGIGIEPFKPPVFKADNYQSIPWYMNTDTSLLNYVKSTITQKEEEFKFTGKDNVLTPVTITAKKVVKGSHNLNGEGGADLTLDETDMKKAGKKNLLQLLQEKIPLWMEKNAMGNYIIIHHGGGSAYYVYTDSYYSIGNKKANILIDGVSLDLMYEPPIAPVYNHYYDYIRQYLEYFTAEDVKGIELMKPGKYNAIYNRDFVPIEWWGYNDPKMPGKLQPVRYNESMAGATRGVSAIKETSQSFIEITTRAGQGPWSMITPGTYLFKTMPFASTKQFYSPKYTVKNKPAPLSDLRSTIFWEPHVITDASGKASISFYSADRAGSYTVIAEGSDMNGGIGRRRVVGLRITK